MFGNPFRKHIPVSEFPNEPCRWCLARIGLVSHYPMPLCSACMADAFKNAYPSAPKGNLWERMMTEFRSEAIAWCKREQARPTRLETLATATEATGDITKLRLAQVIATRAGNQAEVNRLEAEITHLQELINRYRQEVPGLVAELERES